MAKGIGLIGNFKGKVGNMVGYKLTDSNSGNTQGIRVYQPIVKNPKTAAQAEQRAKLAPINATYRALKMVIDRGNEGLPYGNKSRLAWLKQAFKAEGMPWFEKNAVINSPVLCQLSKGSLSGLDFTIDDGILNIQASGVTGETTLNTLGKVSTALLAAYPSLKAGDQLTFIGISGKTSGMVSEVFSFIIDSTDATETTKFNAANGVIEYGLISDGTIGSVIVSREGDGGEHLRSTSYLEIWSDAATHAPYDSTSKTAAIESYMSSAAVNADWAEESIQ